MCKSFGRDGDESNVGVKDKHKRTKCEIEVFVVEKSIIILVEEKRKNKKTLKKGTNF